MLLAEEENAGARILEVPVVVGAEVAGDVAVLGTVLVMALHQQLGVVVAEDAADFAEEGQGKGLVSLLPVRTNVHLQGGQDLAHLVQLSGFVWLAGGKTGSELDSNHLTGDGGALRRVGLERFCESFGPEDCVLGI